MISHILNIKQTIQGSYIRYYILILPIEIVQNYDFYTYGVGIQIYIRHDDGAINYWKSALIVGRSGNRQDKLKGRL